MKRSFLINMWLALFWVLMVVPTLLWFKESVLFVALVSIYALVIGHISTAEAARSGVQEDTLRQIRALTDALADFMAIYQEDQPDDAMQTSIDELKDSLDKDQTKP
jgi:hypothetical protein